MSTPAPRKATQAFGQQPLVYLIFVAQALLPVFRALARNKGLALKMSNKYPRAPQPCFI
jgi:hypothetical protein